MKKLLLFILSFFLIAPARPIAMTAQNIAIGGTATAAVLGAAALIAQGQIKRAEQQAKHTPTKKNQALVKTLHAAAKALGLAALGVFLIGGFGALGQWYRLHAKDAEGNTLLLRAARQGNLKKAQSLVRQGANLKAKNNLQASTQQLLLQHPHIPLADIEHLHPKKFGKAVIKGKFVEDAIQKNNPERTNALLASLTSGSGNAAHIAPSALIQAIRHYKGTSDASPLKKQWLQAATTLATALPVERYGQEVKDSAYSKIHTNPLIKILRSGNPELITIFLRQVPLAKLTDTQKTEALLAAPTEQFVKALAMRLNNDTTDNLPLQPWFAQALDESIGLGNKADNRENPERIQWLCKAMPSHDILKAIPLRLLIGNSKWTTVACVLRNGAQPSPYNSTLGNPDTSALNAFAQEAASDGPPFSTKKKEAFGLLAPHYIAECLLANDTDHINAWLDGLQRQHIPLDFDAPPLYAAMIKLSRAPEEIQNRMDSLGLLVSHLRDTPEDEEKIAGTMSPETRDALINTAIAGNNLQFLGGLAALQCCLSPSSRRDGLCAILNALLRLPDTPDTKGLIDFIIDHPAFESVASDFGTLRPIIMETISGHNAYAVQKILAKGQEYEAKKAALHEPTHHSTPTGATYAQEAASSLVNAGTQAYQSVMTFLGDVGKRVKNWFS